MAEVLIVLGLIGTVANLTIPTLMKDVQKQTYVAQLKKSYTTLGQAVSQLATNYGCVGNLKCTGLFDTDNQAGTADEIVKNLKILKKCTSGDTSCFGSAYKTYHGKWPPDDPDSDPQYAGINNLRAPNAINYILTDGTAISIITINCNLYTYCGVFNIDINGGKRPNAVGRDYFTFVIMPDGSLYPAGGSKISAYSVWTGTSTFNCTSPPLGGDSMGYGCAARIMEEGWQMNY